MLGCELLDLATMKGRWCCRAAGSRYLQVGLASAPGGIAEQLVPFAVPVLLAVPSASACTPAQLWG